MQNIGSELLVGPLHLGDEALMVITVKQLNAPLSVRSLKVTTHASYNNALTRILVSQ